jgi:inner membrane protein
MLVVSGLASDLDYLSHLGGASAFMRFHRTALHSVAGSALMSCVVAGAFCILDRKFPQQKTVRVRKKTFPPLAFGAAFAVCAVGAAGHVLLDLASGVGVQLLWPFRVHWSAWNLVSDLDLWILILLAVGLLLPLLFGLVNEEVGAREKGPGGSRGAVITLLLLAAYLGERVNLHSRAIDLLLSREYRGRVPLSAGAFPESSGPFRWRGVAVTDDTIEVLEVPLGPGDEFDSDRSLTQYKANDSSALDAGEATPAAEKFLAYAEFPLATVDRRETGYRLEIHDLRFEQDDTEPANVFVRVDLDSGLQVKREQILFVASPNP